MTPSLQHSHTTLPTIRRMAMASLMALAIPCAEMAGERIAAAPSGGEWWLLLGAGTVGIFDPDPKAIASVEYRYTTGRHHLGPWLALEATERDLFIGFGAFVDLPMGRRWVFTPSLGAAIYQEHDGLGLGYPLEYRSAAELTYRIERWRWGASFSHYSNASLGEDNAGTEILKILFVVPVGRFGLP